ncbi:comF family protein [Chitinophaga costaii]|uniref:ComF family protein n=1 Tax=Chitinophaga costaii TaxID=1335309 RepID=A0A1C4A9E6_9BACT|nr:ComF family protein [Chitinophaga costaii]PUZ26513.1 ComF family protein [Chitinophaga costaii]SCB91195.1 comF family protein [Chitinophaga costaii]
MRISRFLAPLGQLFYPHNCDACGSELTLSEEILCLRCLHKLPLTRYQLIDNNPLQRTYRGRVDIQHAFAAYYYEPGSPVQQLVHQFKYLGREDIAHFLGRKMGRLLQESPWRNAVDAIVPVPLYTDKLKQRGYNQALLLAEGMSEILQIAVWPHAIRRHRPGTSQTQKGRLDRWQQLKDMFSLGDAVTLAQQHVLLVDDVITTGATTEACASLLLQIPGTCVSICSLAVAES